MTIAYFSTLFSMVFSLFLLMDPIGNIPAYLSVLKQIDPKRKPNIILRELFIALGIIIAFAFLGESLLKTLKISQETVFIAGGVILFIIALRMIFPHMGQARVDIKVDEEPFIVPLAIPFVAGPSVLAAVIIYAKQMGDLPGCVLAIVLAWGISALILLSSTRIEKLLKPRGLIACERLMGLILTLLSIQMFLEGLHLFMHNPLSHQI